MVGYPPDAAATGAIDEVFDQLEQRSPVGAPIVGDRRRRRRDDDEVEVGHDEDVLTAEPPRVVRLMSGQLAHPPAVAVLAGR